MARQQLGPATTDHPRAAVPRAKPRTKRGSTAALPWLGAALSVTLLIFGTPDIEAASGRGQLAVATENARSTHAAMQTLQAGGNAADAAVTAALVAGVTSPGSSGIGGGCFIHYFDATSGKTTILDARETAPASIVAADFEARPFASESRGKWVGVPGEVAGLHELHRRFGKLPWAKVVHPAVVAAQNGFQVSPHLARVVGWAKDAMRNDPSLRSLWLSKPLQGGATIKSPKLARSLQRIETEGPKALYEGAIASELATTTRGAGGWLSVDDLKNYSVTQRDSLHVAWAGYDVYTMPPPSAGGLMLVQALSLFRKDELRSLGFNTPAYQHALAEAFRAAIADRMRYLGDPNVEAVPTSALLDPGRMKRRRQRIALDRTHAIPRFGLEEHGTHHLVTGDAEGNVVSLTTTVNRAFGAKLTAPQSGVVLNDELDDFTLRTDVAQFNLAQSPNRPRPGAKPVSSMTPTIVIKDGKVVLAAGGSGGMAIAPNVAQAVIARLTFDLPLKEILDGPRFQIPTSESTILVPQDTSAAHIADLQRRGEIVGTVRFTGTAVQLLGNDGSVKTAAADPRKFGVASVK